MIKISGILEEPTENLQLEEILAEHQYMSPMEVSVCQENL